LFRPVSWRNSIVAAEKVEMARIERFEDIEGWKMARELTKLIYNAAKQPDFSRDFGLRDQILTIAA